MMATNILPFRLGRLSGASRGFFPDDRTRRPQVQNFVACVIFTHSRSETSFRVKTVRPDTLLHA